MTRDIDNPLRDKALKRAFAAMESGRVQCLSLDIFDTLLWRHYGKPTDLFRYLGDVLAQDQLFPPQLAGDEIARARIDSEKTARQAGLAIRDSVEVNLDEIWQHSVLPLLAGKNIQDAINTEIAIEAAALNPDQAVVELVRLANNMSIPVILVSDTYFTEAMLTGLLHKACPDLGQIHRIYPSCDHRTSKATGLFDLVLKDTGLQAEQILHVGDSFDSDIAPAAALGVNCQHYSNHVDTVIQCRSREMQDAAGNDLDRMMKGQYGDFGLNRLRTRLIRTDATRPRSKQPAMLWDRGMAVMGPALSSYINWAAHRIEEIQPDHVLCLMREGAFLKSLLDDIRPDANDTDILWASRQVLKKIAIFDASRDELESYIDRPYPTTIGALLQDFAIDKDVINALPAPLLELYLDTDSAKNQFFDFLAGRMDIQHDIRAFAANLRAAYLEWLRPYIGETGKATTLVLMDLGYSGSIQHGLCKLIRSLPGMENVTLHGLYMFVNHKAEKNVLPGSVMEGFACSMGAPAMISRVITRSPELLEQVCMPREGSLTGIDDTGQPELAANLIPEEQQQQLDIMRKGVRAFHAVWSDMLSKQDKSPPLFWQELATAASRPLISFIQQPGIHEAVLFGAFLHDENLGSSRIRALADPNRFVLRKSHISSAALAASKSSDLFWPQAAACMGGAEVVQAMRQANIRSLEAGINISKQQRNVEITLHGPAGQSLSLVKPAWRCQTENYRATIRLLAQEWPITAITINPQTSATICRIDAVDLHLPAADFEDSFMPQHIDQGVTDQAMAISENSFIVLSTQASWHSPISLPKNSWSAGKTIEIDLCFALIPLAPVYDNAGKPEVTAGPDGQD